MFHFNEKSSENLQYCCIFTWNNAFHAQQAQRNILLKHKSQSKDIKQNVKSVKKMANGTPIKQCLSLKKSNRRSNRNSQLKTHQSKSPISKLVQANFRLSDIIEQNKLQKANQNFQGVRYQKNILQQRKFNVQSRESRTITNQDIISKPMGHNIDRQPMNLDFINYQNSKQSLPMTTDRTTTERTNKKTLTPVNFDYQNRGSFKQKIETKEYYKKEKYNKENNLQAHCFKKIDIKNEQKELLRINEGTSLHKKIQQGAKYQNLIDPLNAVVSWEYIRTEVVNQSSGMHLKSVVPLKKLLFSESQIIPTVNSICQSANHEPKIQESQIFINFFHPSQNNIKFLKQKQQKFPAKQPDLNIYFQNKVQVDSYKSDEAI